MSEHSCEPPVDLTDDPPTWTCPCGRVWELWHLAPAREGALSALRAFVHDRGWSEPYRIKVEGEEDFDIVADRAVHRLTPELVARFRAAEDEMYAAANAVTAYLKTTGQPRPWGMPDEDWNKAAELKEER